LKKAQFFSAAKLRSVSLEWGTELPKRGIEKGGIFQRSHKAI
jgi:hypothetical protein